MNRQSISGGAVLLVAAGLVCQEIGASIAVLLFPQAGPLGMTALRLFFSAAILLIIARPSLRARSGEAWRSIVALGVSIAVMNGFFYLALERLALGVTVTIEVLGPLALAVVTAGRRVVWLWAAVALAGVVALGGGGWDRLDPVGVIFALGAAVCWVVYILSASGVGKTTAKLDGLALAMTVGALLALPFGFLAAGTTLLRPELLALGAAVALLSSTIPYAFELVALRRLSPAVFGILMSLAPATAALAGFVLLGQHLTVAELVGIGLVVIASAGAVWAGRERISLASEPVA